MADNFEYFPPLPNDVEKSLIYYSSSLLADSGLIVLTLGHEQCNYDKPPQGPKTTSYYTMHYILNGEGTFSGSPGRLKAGDIFVIFPHTAFSYKQDPGNPWEYIWASFAGLNAGDYMRRCGFSPERPVYHTDDPEVRTAFENFRQVEKFANSRDIKAVSELTGVFALIAEARASEEPQQNAGQTHYIESAKAYIDAHYSDSVFGLKELSEHLCLNQNYVSRLFSRILNMPFSRYLIILRMQKACKLIQETKLSYGAISVMVGYEDPMYFSRLFKKYVGYPPREFRKYNFTKDT